MSNFVVERRDTGEIVYAYGADNAVEWPEYPFAQFNHVREKIIEAAPIPRRVTKLDFVARLGDDAFDELLLMARQSVAIEKFVKLIDWATPDADGTSIDLDDPRVQAVRNLEPILIASGKVTAGWADSVLS